MYQPANITQTNTALLDRVRIKVTVTVQVQYQHTG